MKYAYDLESYLQLDATIRDRADRAKQKIAQMTPEAGAKFREEFAQAILPLVAEQDEFQKTNPYTTFTPWTPGSKMWDCAKGEWRDCYHSSQAKVIQAVEDAVAGKGKRYILVTAGNQGGKSTVGAWVAWRELMRGPGRRLWCFASEKGMGVQNQQQAMWNMRCWSEAHKKQRPFNPMDGFGREYPRLVVQRPSWPKGAEPSLADFKTYGSGVTTAQSGTLDMIWFDEIPPMDILGEAFPRVMIRKGIILITATFVDLDEVYETVTDSDEWEVITLSVYDNPSQDAEEIDRLRRLNPEEAEARITGIPLIRGGRVFPRWKQAPPFYQPFRNAPAREEMNSIVTVDFHASKAAALLLSGVDSDGLIWTLDEDLFDGGDPVMLCKTLWEMLYDRKIPPQEWQEMIRTGFQNARRTPGRYPTTCVLDSHIKDATKSFGIDLNAVFLEHGLPMVNSDRIEVREGHSIMNACFDGSWNHVLGKDGPGTADTPVPQVIITDRCPILARQVQRLQWDIRHSKASIRRMGLTTGKPRQLDDDLVDCLKYTIVQAPKRYVTMDEVKEAQRKHRQRAARKRPRGFEGARILA